MHFSNINENCPEPCQEQHDEAMYFSDYDSDTDYDYMLEEDDDEDLSDDSDDCMGGDEEVKYYISRKGIICFV